MTAVPKLPMPRVMLDVFLLVGKFKFEFLDQRLGLMRVGRFFVRS